MTDFKAFQNESQVVEVDGLTVENRLDRVSIHGSIDITLDQVGMNRAHALKKLIDSIVLGFSSVQGKLPDNLTTEPTGTSKNPFE